MSELLASGGYGAFVWPAYGLTAVVLGLILWRTLARWRRAKERLGALEAARREAPGR